MAKHGATICYNCGRRYGDPRRTSIVATFEDGTCDYCGQESVSVTDARDYGYPPLPKEAARG